MFILCCNTLSFDWRMCAFVVLGSVFAHQAKRLALACGNVSEITHFVSSWMKKPNSVLLAATRSWLSNSSNS